MSDESLRACARCDHPKRVHQLPRSEGGAGGGDSGHCTIYACGCRGYEPGDHTVVVEYVGDEMPSWVKEGVRVKVKATPESRKYGIAPGRGNDNIFAGEVGEIVRQEGAETWRWVVVFSSYRVLPLDTERLELLKKVRT